MSVDLELAPKRKRPAGVVQRGALYEFATLTVLFSYNGHGCLRQHCCYANQDKIWVTAPDGESWEVIVTHGDAEVEPIVASCGLDAVGIRRQGDRYRRLGETADAVERTEGMLRVRFGSDLDEPLLRETIAVEAGCCSFFRLDYEPGERMLAITVTTPEHDAALDAIADALRASATE